MDNCMVGYYIQSLMDKYGCEHVAKRIEVMKREVDKATALIAEADRGCASVLTDVSGMLGRMAEDVKEAPKP